jgi:mannose-1-phosphate guanylyltransferase
MSRVGGDRAIWNIVLAAGDGTRMRELARAVYGTDLPKQFLSFGDRQSLLQRTIERIGPIAPPSRTVVVVSPTHAELAARQLRPYPGIELAVQPLNRGTGPGVLLPLRRVLARDPQADVVVFPCDHEFARPDRLVEGVDRMLVAAQLGSSGVALIGVPAERAASDLGWILPGQRMGPDAIGARLILRFEEKPDDQTAMPLLQSGGLWNTLILGGSAQALWRLTAGHLPQQSGLLASWSLSENGRLRALRQLYLRLPPADFSRDVLQKAEGLVVVPLLDSGWSDLGTPQRLLESLRRNVHGSETVRRITRLARALAPAQSEADQAISGARE